MVEHLSHGNRKHACETCIGDTKHKTQNTQHTTISQTHTKWNTLVPMRKPWMLSMGPSPPKNAFGGKIRSAKQTKKCRSGVEKPPQQPGADIAEGSTPIIEVVCSHFDVAGRGGGNVQIEILDLDTIGSLGQTRYNKILGNPGGKPLKKIWTAFQGFL